MKGIFLVIYIKSEKSRKNKNWFWKISKIRNKFSQNFFENFLHFSQYIFWVFAYVVLYFTENVFAER